MSEEWQREARRERRWEIAAKVYWSVFLLTEAAVVGGIAWEIVHV